MTRIGTDVAAAVEILRSGGLVGLPTETVYGLAADAARREAVRRVFAAKGRPADHPLIVHVASADHLERWARAVPDDAVPLLERWWPGPLTVLLPRSEQVLDEVTGGRDTVALRSPAHPLAQDLLRSFGGGLVAPSANRFGRVSPTTAVDVVEELGAAVDMVLDGGPSTVGIESTIVDLSSEPPRLLRPGAVTAEALRSELPGLTEASRAAPVVAPGMLASHYAPDAWIVLLAHDADTEHLASAVEGQLAAGRRVGVLAPAAPRGLPAEAVVLPDAGGPDDYARALYARLREADHAGLDVLVVVPPPPEGAGLAVADRLQRAAHRS